MKSVKPKSLVLLLVCGMLAWFVLKLIGGSEVATTVISMTSLLVGFLSLRDAGLFVSTVEKHLESPTAPEVTSPIRKFFSDNIVFGLSALIFGAALLASVLSATLIYSVADLEKKGLIAFPQGTNGWVHLATQVNGLVIMGVLATTFSLYGFSRGYALHQLGLRKIYFSTVVGASAYTLYSMATDGVKTVMASFGMVLQANGISPESAHGLVPLLSVLLMLFVWFGYSLYIWGVQYVGVVLRTVMDKWDNNNQLPTDSVVVPPAPVPTGTTTEPALVGKTPEIVAVPKVPEPVPARKAPEQIPQVVTKTA